MIVFNNLSLKRAQTELLENANATINLKQKVGLVGKNGCGKSSLFALLKKQLQPESGEVTYPSNWALSWVNQETPALEISALDYVIQGDREYCRLQAELAQANKCNDGNAIARIHDRLDTINAWTIQSRAETLLHGLGFTQAETAQAVKSFSGGWRMRLNLAQALLCPSDLLLLDEPTNDLDIPTLEVLEDFLDSFSGVIITVCHDRYFLDRVVDKLFVFTGDGHIEIVHGSYSDYKDALDESSGSKRPFYMPNDNIPANSKAVRAVKGGEADSDDSVDNQSNRVDTLGNDNVVASDETDTFKEIPKKGLNKAEEAEYAKIMDELPKLEHLVKGLDVMISQVATDYEKMQSLMEEREETQTQIDALTERWMELEERQ